MAFKERGSLKELGVAALVGAGAMVYTWFYFDRGLDAFDVGLFAVEAERAASGAIYGTDFLAPYGPGRYYLLGAFFKVFGATLKVQGLFWLLMRGLTASLCYGVSRFFMPRGMALVPALIVTLAPGALHKALFQAGALVCVFQWLWYHRNPSLKSCLAGGFFMGLVALFRVDAGVFGWLSFQALLLLQIRSKKQIKTVLIHSAALAGGAAVLIGPFVVWLMIRSDPSFILEAELHRTRTVSDFAGYLKTSGVLSCMIWSAPILYLLAPFFGRKALCLTLFGLPVLNQVRITPTFNHFLHAAPLVFICACCLLHRLNRKKPLHLVIITWLLFICVAPVVYNFLYAKGVLPPGLANRGVFTTPIPLERAGFYETSTEAKRLEKIVRYIRENTEPDQPLMAPVFSPVLNFLADRPPALRMLEPFYYFNNPELQKAMVQDLERCKPPIIILDPSVSVGRQTLRNNASLLYSHITLSYQLAGSSNRDSLELQIWIRR